MKRFYLLILVCLFPLLASGQALKGSYFSEYSVLRNKLNPAFVPRSSYLGFAGLDNHQQYRNVQFPLSVRFRHTDDFPAS